MLDIDTSQNVGDVKSLITPEIILANIGDLNFEIARLKQEEQQRQAGLNCNAEVLKYISSQSGLKFKEGSVSPAVVRANKQLSLLGKKIRSLEDHVAKLDEELKDLVKHEDQNSNGLVPSESRASSGTQTSTVPLGREAGNRVWSGFFSSVFGNSPA
jgi:hypothetical protein